MYRSISAARSHNDAVDLAQPDHRSSVSQFTHDSTNTYGSLEMANRGASSNEVIVTPRSIETNREAGDEAENLIQFEPLDEAALASHTTLGIQHHSSTNVVSIIGSITSPVRPTKAEFEHGSTHTRRFYHKWYNSWIDGWRAEILGCSVSAAALFCLIATLQYFEGRVITEMPLKINMNSLVAVLATTIKATLLLAVAEGRFYDRLKLSIF
jgi:hypothetical protein